MDITSKISPKKSLGQNFLIDEVVLKDIVSAIDPKKGEIIVEIGPGRGALTMPLLESGAKIIGIEKDERLVAELKINYPKLTIIEGDALNIIENCKLKIVNSDKWKLVGNIPYYITGHLFRIISELKDKPSLMVFMIQKEVAERICAGSGMNPVRNREGSERASVSNGMNLLSASIQVWAEPEIVRLVDRKAFNPVPKVDSAVIRLKTSKKQLATGELENYYKLLHIVFKQPRKTLFNNLRSVGIAEERIKDIFEKLDINMKARSQDLSIEKLKELSKVLG